MSITGFKKQINKANQFVSEKIGGARGTELDDDFIAMEKQVDILGRLVDDMTTKTQELLQPNPASRAKMLAMKGITKIRGQHNTLLYPQPEGLLGECMIKHGRDLSVESSLGEALVESGEAFKQLADIKYSLEDAVRQNFLEPLHNLQTKDLKEVNHHRKKLSGRRLDFDCKKRKQQKGSSVTDDELAEAEEKFDESKQLAETAMHNLLENEVEQLSQLASFVEAAQLYHQQSAEVLHSLLGALRERCNDASSKPRHEHVPKPIKSRSSTSSGSGRRSTSSRENNYSFSEPQYETEKSVPVTASKRNQPYAEALYDFDAENPGELEFREGDRINLVSHVDENWMEGSVNGKVGLFPATYVQIIVDLP